MKTIILNFKTYAEATGNNALRLARACDRVAKRHPEVEIIVCPQYTDLTAVSSMKNIKVFAQHIDPLEPGKGTGSTTAFAVKDAGVSGTLISHSERKLSLEDIGKCVSAAKKYGLRTLVCSDTMERTSEIAKIGADYIAYEDPALIGSGIPISKTRPDDVKKFAGIVSQSCKSVPICGAGISSSEDFRSAIELGTKGVILASGFVKSADPENFLEDMVNAAV